MSINERTSLGKVLKGCFSKVCTHGEGVSSSRSPDQKMAVSYNEQSQALTFPHRTTPQDGFLFLHMMTCCDLVYPKPFLQEDISDYAGPTSTDLNAQVDKGSEEEKALMLSVAHKKTGQVNAKSLVKLLSRRPFSFMWKDIMPGVPYIPFVTQRVTSDFFKYLQSEFRGISYGSIFFTDEGEPQDPTTQEPFKSRIQQEVSGNTFYLLKNGVLSTNAVRLAEAGVLNNYFDEMLASISPDTPPQRLVFNLGVQKIEAVVSTDLLSPTHFSPDGDSMGAYKSNNHDPKYGGAIVEFRDISSPSTSVLQKTLKLFCNEEEYVRRKDSLTKNMRKNFLSQLHYGDKFTLRKKTEGLLFYIEHLLRVEEDE